MTITPDLPMGSLPQVGGGVHTSGGAMPMGSGMHGGVRAMPCTPGGLPGMAPPMPVQLGAGMAMVGMQPNAHVNMAPMPTLAPPAPPAAPPPPQMPPPIRPQNAPIDPEDLKKAAVLTAYKEHAHGGLVQL